MEPLPAPVQLVLALLRMRGQQASELLPELLSELQLPLEPLLLMLVQPKLQLASQPGRSLALEPLLEPLLAQWVSEPTPGLAQLE